MKIEVLISSTKAYKHGIPTGEGKWLRLPVIDPDKQAKKIISDIGGSYFVAMVNAPFNVADDASLKEINHLAQVFKDEGIDNLTDLYNYVTSNVDSAKWPKMISFDSEDDLNQELAGLTPYELLKSIGPHLNLSDDYFYWNGGLLNSIDEGSLKSWIHRDATQLVKCFITYYDSVFEDEVPETVVD